MTALASTNVAVTITSRKSLPKRRSHIFSLTFGDGALTYPSGGVPLPDFHGFGFARFMEAIDLIDQASANGFTYKWDQTNNKLRIYQGDNTNAAAAPAVELTTAATPAAATLKGEALGW